MTQRRAAANARPFWLGTLAGVLLAGLVATLFQGAGHDGEQGRLCRSLIPALEPAGALIVVAIEADPLAPNAVRIDYRVDDRPSRLRCAFGGGFLDTRRLDLRAVEVNGVQLGEARLFVLERFWLGDPQAVAEGEARLSGVGAGTPLLPGRVSAAAGYALQQGLNALPVAAVYAFLAVAYALVYGLVNRINLAFGELAVLGAYGTVAVISAFAAGSGLSSAAAGGLAVLIGVAVAIGQAGLAGGVIGSVVFRRLSQVGHRAFLIATIGLAIAIGEAIRLASGSRDRWIQPLLADPILILDGEFQVTLTVMRFIEVTAAVLVLSAVLVAMHRSRFGLSWRAAADDPLMARLLGLDTGRIATITFVLSAALAGFAGAMTALHYGQASYGAGALIGLKALVAALLGGIGSLPGAAIGGLVIGLAETLWSAYLPIEQRDIAILTVLILVLVFRPEGLLGLSRPASDTADRRWIGSA